MMMMMTVDSVTAVGKVVLLTFFSFASQSEFF